MTFYLKPAEGIISANLFCQYTESRLKLLISLRHAKYPSQNSQQVFSVSQEALPNADCLIEGTSKDRVSHFALLSVSALHFPMHSYVLKKEVLLFQHRLMKMSYDELKQSLMVLLKQLQEYKSSRDQTFTKYVNELDEVLRRLLKKRLLLHVADKRNGSSHLATNLCPDHGNDTVLSVPFQHVLNLMAQREVTLSNGLANLRCDQVHLYLTQMFSKLLSFTSSKLQEPVVSRKIRDDPRCADALQPLMALYDNALPPKLCLEISKELRLGNLDEMSQYFPPCMRALHTTLRKRHRLCHKPRVQYTLFLKEVGLPVDDCLELIRTEYSRPALHSGQQHKCEHSWDQDARRYTYGTRHLYGLEGGKVNYSAHTCQSIQKDSPGPNECGGCPWTHYDRDNLQKFLKIDLGDKEATFSPACRGGKVLPIESCHLHLRSKSRYLAQSRETHPTQVMLGYENSQVKTYNVFKPKDYFLLMDKLVNPQKVEL